MNKIKELLPVILFLIVQTVAAVWWASSINSQVIDNSNRIASLETKNVVLVDRTQLNDILSGRDVEIKAIQDSQSRVEKKVDALVNRLLK